MNSHREHRLRLIVHQVPAAAIAHVRADRGKRLSPFAIFPGVEIAIVGDVADDGRGNDLPGAALPVVDDELAKAGKIASSGAKPSGAAGKALAVERDIGAVLGPHRLP